MIRAARIEEAARALQAALDNAEWDESQYEAWCRGQRAIDMARNNLRDALDAALAAPEDEPAPAQATCPAVLAACSECGARLATGANFDEDGDIEARVEPHKCGGAK